MNKIINLHVDHWHLVFDIEEEQVPKTFDDYLEEISMHQEYLEESAAPATL